MSKSAWLFLCLTVVTGLLALGATSEEGQTAAMVAAGVSTSLLLLTLFMGRKIKFDPILR
ncbi:PA3371 family protein [Pseudomonas sp. L1(2025)]|uniref:PA3371 family protein n=1 Tax=Pseudomonas sp. L1(2025) TaxID=3449429 RepID=UPI003F6935A2